MPDPLPSLAAWRHVDSRDGFEVVRLESLWGGGLRCSGSTSAVAEGRAWSVRYTIELDGAWRTRRARIDGVSAAGERRLEITADGKGHWRIAGAPAPLLEGCLDLDLESSGLTNAFPLRRLQPAIGERVDAPAAWLRADTLTLERLDQVYTRLGDMPSGGGARYAYEAPAFDFAVEITYDDAGLVVDYPAIAHRVPLGA